MTSTVWTYADWQALKVGEKSAFLAAMHSGEPFECDEEMFYYWLEVLPPVYMGALIILPSSSDCMSICGLVMNISPLQVMTILFRIISSRSI